MESNKHYRKTNNCRVSRPLPSARPRALGKHDLCRVPAKGHSANTWHTACPNFAESWPSTKYGTWQSLLFAECHRARTRQRPRTCPARAPAVRRPLGWLTALSLCRVSTRGTRQRSIFAECPQLALGKASFAECPGSSTRQTWLIFFFELSNFFVLYLNLRM